MAGFLTDEWVELLDRAARQAQVSPDADVVVQQVIDGGDHEIAYAVRVRDGRVRVVAGHHADADVVFHQDRATAEAIAQGRLSAQMAFLAGDLRIGGDIQALIERARVLTGVDDIFAAARTETSW